MERRFQARSGDAHLGAGCPVLPRHGGRHGAHGGEQPRCRPARRWPLPTSSGIGPTPLPRSSLPRVTAPTRRLLAGARPRPATRLPQPAAGRVAHAPGTAPGHEGVCRPRAQVLPQRARLRRPRWTALHQSELQRALGPRLQRPAIANDPHRPRATSQRGHHPAQRPGQKPARGAGSVASPGHSHDREVHARGSRAHPRYDGCPRWEPASAENELSRQGRKARKSRSLPYEPRRGARCPCPGRRPPDSRRASQRGGRPHRPEIDLGQQQTGALESAFSGMVRTASAWLPRMVSNAVVSSRSGWGVWSQARTSSGPRKNSWRDLQGSFHGLEGSLERLGVGGCGAPSCN